jgi:hypothetical protein
MPHQHPHLAPTPWPAEDGGPARLQQPVGLAGPGARSATLEAVRHEPVCVMAVQAPGGRLLLLRATMGDDRVGWVEEIHPEHLGVLRRSPDLPTGPFWPGGMAVLADGAVIVVQGRWAHRLTPDLEVERAQRLPVEAPYNSLVVLADGSLVMKDVQRPDGAHSTVSILDPVTLEPKAAPLVLPEPCVARLSAVGDEVFVVGVTALHRLAWDARTAAWGEAAPPATYLTHEGQTFGWDPVVAAGSTWWMDNGDHTFQAGLTMLGNGVGSAPVRLWRAPLDGGPTASVAVSGLPAGAITNPPLVDESRGLVVAYDSANAVLTAFGTEDLAERWRVPMATAHHMVLYPDTGELLVNDHDRTTGDALVVVDVADGSERARAHIGSPAQSVVFCTPGLHRDAIYVSLSTVARVSFGD